MGSETSRGEGVAEQIGGKIKEVIGKVTGKAETEAEGKAQELKGQAEEAGGCGQRVAERVGCEPRYVDRLAGGCACCRCSTNPILWTARFLKKPSTLRRRGRRGKRSVPSSRRPSGPFAL